MPVYDSRSPAERAENQDPSDNVLRKDHASDRTFGNPQFLQDPDLDPDLSHNCLKLFFVLYSIGGLAWAVQAPVIVFLVFFPLFFLVILVRIAQLSRRPFVRVGKLAVAGDYEKALKIGMSRLHKHPEDFQTRLNVCTVVEILSFRYSPIPSGSPRPFLTLPNREAASNLSNVRDRSHFIDAIGESEARLNTPQSPNIADLRRMLFRLPRSGGSSSLHFPKQSCMEYPLMRRGLRTRILTTVLVFAASTALVSATESTTYRGVLMPAKGFTPIPEGGAPIHVTVEKSTDGSLKGRLRTMGVDAPLSKIEAVKNTIVLTGTIGPMPVTAELTHDGLELRGTVKALQFVFPVVPMPSDWIPRDPKPFNKITRQDWLADLAYLAEALPKNHKDWYSLIEEEDWRGEVAKAEKTISNSTPEAGLVALVELIAAGRDPHTWLRLSGQGPFKTAPVQVRWFPDGLYLTSAPREHQSLIGGLVVRIGNVTTEIALERLARLMAWDNPQWKRLRVAGLVPIPRLLHVLGLSDDPETLDLVVRDRKGKEDQTLTVAKGGRRRQIDWQEAFDVEAPLWLTHLEKPYWFTEMKENSALYLAYNQCESDPKMPFDEFVTSVMTRLRAGGIKRVVVDLRNNFGGNSNVIEPLLLSLGKHKIINQPDRLFVLIGPGTFSSAMLNAIQFETSTQATLVGEPTGGKPNQFGNISHRYLPNSGLSFPVSTKYFHLDPSDPASVTPKIPVVLKSSDFFSGRDPVLETVHGIPIESEP